MFVRFAALALTATLIAACGPGDDAATVGAPAEAPAAEQGTVVAAAQAPACEPMANRMAIAGRASPYDSTVVALGDAQAKVCYGRPARRDREIFGGLVPFDTLWRTGANEPTTIHVPVAAEIAGVAVQPGSYSLYTVPGREQWTIIVNRSVDQWGIESQYTEAVRAQEVGRGQVPVEAIPTAEETFTIDAEQTAPDAANLVLTWENTRVRVPIRRT
jgi:hypothetical protein